MKRDPHKRLRWSITPRGPRVRNPGMAPGLVLKTRRRRMFVGTELELGHLLCREFAGQDVRVCWQQGKYFIRADSSWVQRARDRAAAELVEQDLARHDDQP